MPLNQLATRFRLSRFEIQFIVLGLASHVEPRMTSLVASSNRELFSRSVTVRLALERFCDSVSERIAQRQAFAPEGRLLSHGLISLGKVEVGGTGSLLARRLELTTPTLRFLLQEGGLIINTAQP